MREQPPAALSLQHDIEVTPKGGAILNAPNQFAVARDAQLLLDATDAGGRCHDQGTLGLTGNPRGGLEIIDITDVSMPHEIGLTVTSASRIRSTSTPSGRTSRTRSRRTR